MIVSPELFMALNILLGIALWSISSRKDKQISNVLPGSQLYFAWGVLAIVIGALYHTGYEVLRTSYYWMHGVTSLLCGAIIARRYEKKVIIKSLVIAHFIISLICFWSFFTSGSLSFNSIRVAFRSEMEALEFIFPIYLFYIKEKGASLFKPALNYTILFIFIIRIVLGLSRTVIIAVAIGVCIYMLFDKNKLTVRGASATFTIFIVIGFAALGMFFISPEATAGYWGKVGNVFNEVEITGNFSSYGEALGNWRVYENYCATVQWKEYSTLRKIIGEGFGTLIKTQYMPTTWATTDFYELGAIPLLHNGFLTLLCVGGVTGVGCYVFPFVNGLRYAWQRRTRDVKSAVCLAILLIMMLLNTYVVRGLFGEDLNITWGILVSMYVYSLQEGKE
jgi:hypothetical protein